MVVTLRPMLCHLLRQMTSPKRSAGKQLVINWPLTGYTRWLLIGALNNVALVIMWSFCGCRRSCSCLLIVCVVSLTVTVRVCNSCLALPFRAVLIKLFTGQILRQASHPIVKYSTGTRSSYMVAQNYDTPGSSFKFIIKQQFEMSRCSVRNASEMLIKRSCSLQNSHRGWKLEDTDTGISIFFKIF